MNADQLKEALENGKQTPKHLGRLYIYASASHLEEEILTDLKESIKIILVLDEESFYHLIEKASLAWQTKIEQFEPLIQHCEAIKGLERLSKKKGKEEKRIASLRALFINIISLSLQKFSIQTGKNHLTKKDLAFLDELFKDPNSLAPYEKCFYFPFQQVQKGKWKVTSEQFLFQCLFQIQWLADFLEAKITNHQAKQAILLELFEMQKHFSLEDLQLFLKQPIQSKSGSAIFSLITENSFRLSLYEENGLSRE